MDVVEARPKLLFVTHADIPVGVPDLSSALVVEVVHQKGCFAMQAIDEFAEYRSMLWLNKNMVMVRLHHPGACGNSQFSGYRKECVTPDRQVFIGCQEFLMVLRGGGNEIPGIVSVEVNRAMRR